MIDKLNIIANKLANIDINELTEQVLNKNQEVLIDMNVLQLKDEGRYSTGGLISDILPYTNPTIAIKKELGTLTNNNPNIVNLHDEGDFHSGFFVIFDDKGVIFNSKDRKTGELEDKYGKEIFSLTEENRQEVVDEYLKPEIPILLKNAVNP